MMYMYIGSIQLLHSEGKKSFFSIQQEGWIHPEAMKILAILALMRVLMINLKMMKRARGKTSFSEVLCCYGRISVLNIFLLS